MSSKKLKLLKSLRVERKKIHTKPDVRFLISIGIKANKFDDGLRPGRISAVGEYKKRRED